jgi:serpin B
MRRSFKIVRVFALVAAVACLTTCSEDGTITRLDEGDGASALAGRIADNNDFAFKLYGELKGSAKNLIVSPHSIATCFGMVYAGARGNTEKEIADVLCFEYPPAGFHSVLKRLNDELTSRPDVDLRIANGCWGSDGLHYEPAYLDTLSSCYDAEFDALDFAGDPEAARETINQWVEEQTEGFIKELFPAGSINAATYLVLANTIYFLADWLHQFNPELTDDGTFTRLDGSHVTAGYMHSERKMPFFDGEDYLAMAMPYKGEQVSMVLILPDEGKYQAFEDAFTVAEFNSIVEHLSGQTLISFSIPKFDFYSDFALKTILQNMGVLDAFAPGPADFSGMDGTEDGVPWVDDVVHKAYISVGELGTVACAGTGAVMPGSIPGSCPSFLATRPFIFVIRDNPTGTILFLGRVLDPSAT